MKNILLSAAFALVTAFAFSTTVTISNTGTTFTPATVTIQVGDTIKFQLASSHNALEVSQASWDANDNTPLPGFSVEFGGGIVTGLTAGTHYYVCEPHASIGMKGKIIVNSATGINSMTTGSDKISIYPNPTPGQFTVKYQDAASVNRQPYMQICSLTGEILNSLPILNEETSVNLSALPAGSYIVRINDNENILTKTVVKQ